MDIVEPATVEPDMNGANPGLTESHDKKDVPTQEQLPPPELASEAIPATVSQEDSEHVGVPSTRWGRFANHWRRFARFRPPE